MTRRSQSKNESKRHSGENGKTASGFSHFNPESRFVLSYKIKKSLKDFLTLTRNPVPPDILDSGLKWENLQRFSHFPRNDADVFLSE
ncbi:MAG: hypothetical protein GY749_37705 [Desulfobacteraceae bacterium]|nr:hypothetical protein [Desulfobacteraceae bacterium]